MLADGGYWNSPQMRSVRAEGIEHEMARPRLKCDSFDCGVSPVAGRGIRTRDLSGL